MGWVLGSLGTYLQQSPQVDISLAGLQMMAAAPLIYKTSPSLLEVRGCEEVEEEQGG